MSYDLPINLHGWWTWPQDELQAYEVDQWLEDNIDYFEELGQQALAEHKAGKSYEIELFIGKSGRQYVRLKR